MSEGGFSELVQQASRLTTDMDTAAPLPRVQRNLKQLLQAGEQLWARTAQTGAQDVKASILLGSKGVDLPALSMRLDALDASRTFQPLEPVQDTDIAGFLRNERENAVLTVIEQSRKETFEAVDRAHYEAFSSCWELAKHRLLSTLAPSGHDLLDVTLQPELSVSSSSGAAGVRSTLTAQEKAYVDTIAKYIEQLSSDGPRPDLVTTCRELMAKLGDDVAVELWDTVRCVTQVGVRSEVGRFSNSVQAVMIRQAKRFLETSYVSRLQRLVYSHLSMAGLGGEPGTLQLVQSYLAVRPPTAAPDDALLQGLPAWAVIYHCLRCGDPPAARQAAQRAGPALSDIARVLARVEASQDGRLPPECLSELRQLQYSCRASGTGDHYTRAVCSALGAPDLTDDTVERSADQTASTDDFLWMKLSGLSALPAGDEQRAALSRLQTTLVDKYGESHFDAYNQPALYFRVLLLTGQLEAAVEFLARVERLRAHAVHIALALHELSLLLLARSPQAPLLSSDSDGGGRRLNLARLVLLYTRRFEGPEPESALHYLFLLRRLPPTEGGEDLFAAAAAELALQSGSYERLLGRMAADGRRQPGALDRYDNFDARPVIERVAEECESRGQLEDAVQLYDLADKHDKVLELLNRLLSQLVSSTDTARRERLQGTAIGIARRFKEHGHRGSAESAGTLYLLLDLMSFFDLYRLRRIDEALEVLRRLRLVPLQQNELEMRLAEFGRLQEEVRRCMPDVLLAAMTLLHSAQRGEAGMAPTELRQTARLLITFAGSLPYRLPGDTHARLVQMEVLMN
ncbi:Nuclear pore complex protein Nup93 [Amphibalanus amphitrite]|uniref:Nuclear pore protein n=1 Tax=Amphibalanus amphitrite TaxID=1232801 RepID=A0A6A4XH35_AMPAM|nr:Nuclear pore complex protein Nup93 [Amphibalanus amphitrite]